MKSVRIILCFILFILCGASVVRADEMSDRIAELQQKISQLQNEENSLSKQINLLNSQISLTTLRVNSIKSAIDKLSGEIEELANEIERLEALKTKRLELVLHRIPEAYKRYQISQFGIVFFSQNVTDFFTRVKYLTRVQEEDTELYKQLQNTQDTYGERMNLREQKKEQHEALKKQLEQQSRELDRNKKEKQILLEQTKNSEATYQKLLSQALAEKTALEQALVNSISLGPVKQGDPIALVGNTGYPGCSTGTHLHFEIRRGGTWTDPSEFLSSKTVSDEQNGGSTTLGRGSWPWPIEDTIRLTQHYGHTPYSWRYAYSGGIHTGYDMISTNGSIIRAPKDGTLYSSSQTCGGGSIIKIKYIEHSDGITSFYLHVQ